MRSGFFICSAPARALLRTCPGICSAPACALSRRDDCGSEILSIPGGDLLYDTQTPPIRHPWRGRLRQHPCCRLLVYCRDTRISQSLSYSSRQGTGRRGAANSHFSGECMPGSEHRQAQGTRLPFFQVTVAPWQGTFLEFGEDVC